MIFIMNIEIDKLASVMGLTQYQTNVLKARPDVYNIRRLVKRGSVLYAPRSIHGVVGFVRRMFYGRPADLIGRDKMLVCNQCGIRFFAHGFYSVPIGPFRYYANDNGDIVARPQK